MCETLNRTDVKSFISITPVKWEIIHSFNSVWTSLTDNERTYKAGQYHSNGLQLSELIQNKHVSAPYSFNDTHMYFRLIWLHKEHKKKRKKKNHAEFWLLHLKQWENMQTLSGAKRLASACLTVWDDFVIGSF